MIRAKDGNGCCSSWCCCIRQQIAELWQRIEGTVRGVKMNGNIIEPDGDGIVDLDVNFPVDGAMDPTSVNPVQNRVVTDAILTERSERIEDDRRHDLQIQGLENEMQTKLTTPSGGVQGQVIGKGAQGIGWVDTITEQRAQRMEEDIAGKQDVLISGSNIKTINGNSLLGDGDIAIQAGATVTMYNGMLLTEMFNNGYLENAKFMSGKIYLQSDPYTEIMVNGRMSKTFGEFLVEDGEWCSHGNNSYRNIAEIWISAMPYVNYYADDTVTTVTTLRNNTLRFRGIIIY